MATTGISVIVPVFNQALMTQRCLNSILNGSTIAQHLVVIDNHSTDGTPALLEAFSKAFQARGWKFEVQSNPENLGVARAFNQGISMAKHSYIAIVNNDTWLMPGWDAALLDSLVANHAAMVGPYYDEGPGEIENFLAQSAKFTRRNRKRITNNWCSVLMFFDRTVFDQIGTFDERYFCTCEDNDFKIRMERAGLRYYSVGSCWIWHHSKGTRNSTELPKDYEVRAREEFIKKWGFDPRSLEHSLRARLSRRFKRIRNSLGYL